MNAVLPSINQSAAATAFAYPLYLDALPRVERTMGRYALRCAQTAAELDAILRLRFEVFNLELHECLESSYRTGRDMDEFDLTCHHLVVTDTTSGAIIGDRKSV